MSRKRKNLVGFWLDDNEYLSLKSKISMSGLTRSEERRVGKEC
jgi:hypothetical protein